MTDRYKFEPGEDRFAYSIVDTKTGEIVNGNTVAILLNLFEQGHDFPADDRQL